MSHKKVIAKLDFELEEINKLLDSYTLLIEALKTREPDLIELTAMATILHSFYNGIEKLFLIIGKEIDKNMPSGIKWHRDLLLQMAEVSDARPAAVSSDTINVLNEYLGFRHFYRHAYSFHLTWDKMKGPALNIKETWSIVKSELNEFKDTLRKQRSIEDQPRN